MFTLKGTLGVKDKDKQLLYRTFFLYFCSGMMANAMGSVLKDMRSLEYGYGISAGFQGVLSSVSQFGGLAANLLSGILPFIIGRKKSTVALAVLPVFAICAAVLTGSPYILIMSFLMIGMGKGVNSNITNLVVNQTAGNKGIAQNFLHSFFSSGAILGPVLMASFMQSSWRIPIMIICVMILSAVVLMGTSTLSDEKEERKSGSIALPRSYSFWGNTAIMFFYLAIESCMLSYTVSYFTYSGMFSDSSSNLMASVLWLAVLCGRLITASVIGRVRKSFMILALGISFVISFSLMLSSTSPLSAAAALFFVGLSMSGIYPTVMSTQDAGYMESSFCSGLCIAVSTSATIIMPVIIGSVTNFTGSYKTGLATLLCPASLMIAFMVIKAFQQQD